MHFPTDRRVHAITFDRLLVDHWLEWKIPQNCKCRFDQVNETFTAACSTAEATSRSHEYKRPRKRRRNKVGKGIRKMEGGGGRREYVVVLCPGNISGQMTTSINISMLIQDNFLILSQWEISLPGKWPNMAFSHNILMQWKSTLSLL